ncbi:PP2C family protein-serine/threonine phosphatase [Rhodovulum sp. DZ06]|uniref:PP2C family protein-serine/threonine phosphatase n=1 Tax=Rhodovulum sp. DZ06 TaxID=3425126 RepID=UPI003D330B3E
MSFTGETAPQTMQPLSPRAGGRTDQGPVRDHNEDALALNPAAQMWAVADGMGGHSRGDYASAALKTAVEEAPALPSPRDQLQDLIARVGAVNARLRAEAAADGTGAIGSTLVALLSAGPHGLFAWIGDSRGYLMRAGRMSQVTRDHSVVQALVDSGQLDADKAESHPHAHVLTRAVGAADTAEFDFQQVELQRGDRALLCSDGLTRTLPESRIAGLLAGADDPQAAADALVRAALEATAQDNVTALVVEFY